MLELAHRSEFKSSPRLLYFLYAILTLSQGRLLESNIFLNVVCSGVGKSDQNFEHPCTKYTALLSYFLFFSTFVSDSLSLLHSSLSFGSFLEFSGGRRLALQRALMCLG